MKPKALVLCTLLSMLVLTSCADYLRQPDFTAIAATSQVLYQVDGEIKCDRQRYRVSETGSILITIHVGPQAYAVDGVDLTFEQAAGPLQEASNPVFLGILVDYSSFPGQLVRDGNTLRLRGLSIAAGTTGTIAIPFKAVQVGDYSGRVAVDLCRNESCDSRPDWTTFLVLQVEP